MNLSGGLISVKSTFRRIFFLCFFVCPNFSTKSTTLTLFFFTLCTPISNSAELVMNHSTSSSQHSFSVSNFSIRDKGGSSLPLTILLSPAENRENETFPGFRTCRVDLPIYGFSFARKDLLLSAPEKLKLRQRSL